MDSIKLKEEQLKIEKKLSNEVGGKEQITELRALAEKSDRNALEFKIKELAKHKQAILSQKKSDEKLQQIMEEKKELEAPYREQASKNDLKARFVGLLLQELDNFGE